ncbi:MAG: hypothetical protein ABEJ72_00070 [Candidatus Aenigmatarchaeota archaeon]
MKDEGQIFTLDMLFAIVILSSLLIVSSQAMGIGSRKSRDYINRYSLERSTNDIADVLVKTPGTPKNWEENPENLVSLGFAKIGENSGVIKNFLDSRKISKFASLISESNWNKNGEFEKTIKDFFGTGLDVLFLGDFVLKKGTVKS